MNKAKGKIGIIDYGMSNLTSVLNALNYLESDAGIFSDSSSAKEYDKLILPGVGAFGKAMMNLNERGWQDVIRQHVVIEKKPLLGICLGMQLLLESSTENGFHEGMGLIKGSVKFIGNIAAGLPVPHVGWNALKITKPSVLLSGLDKNDTNFYFNHSYYCDVLNKSLVCATANYGTDIDVAISADNVFAFQFHPEKSQKNGLLILKNFSEL